ncbi:MAG TPA: T9SS type A sorting domain-containing protein, partial [Chitinophagaceae bacterium]
QSGACLEQNSAATTVVVDPTTVGGSTAAGTSPICSGSSTNITLSGNTGAIVKWQYSTDGSTWNDIASTANPLNTGALTTTTQFRAVVQSGACLQENSAATTVTVSQPIDVTSFSGNQTVTYPNNAVFSVVASNVTGYQWQQKTTAIGSVFTNMGSETNSSLTITSPGVALSGYQYKVNLTANVPCPNDYRTATLTVNPASLCLSYDGLTFGVTNTSGCYIIDNGYGAGIIRLIVSVVGSPAGDLSTAIVKFTIPGSLNNVTATYVAAQNGNPAYYYYDWAVPCLGNNVNSTIHEVSWTIGGNYSSGTCNETNALITISRPTNDFTTGGGYIYNNKSKGTIGITANETPSKNNYGFNLKWGNNLKILQGNFNTIIRQGGKQYQVKSNKPTFLSTQALTPYTINNHTYYPYEAVMVYENAVWKDLSLGTSQGGGPTSIIYVRVIDNGEPNTSGTPRIDQISIFYKLNNVVIYSSEEYTVTNNPALIKLMDIVKGNIQVHVAGGPNGTNAPGQPAIETQATLSNGSQQLTQERLNFELKAMPNPTSSSFNLRISSDNLNEQMKITVSDIAGRTIEMFNNVTVGTTFNFGSGYKPGVYIVEVAQGSRRKQIKLVKF